MSGRLQFAQDRLDHLFVAQFRRANEVVDGKIESFAKDAPVRSQFIAISLRLFSFLDCRLLDLLAVLVKTCQEKYVLTQAAARPGDHVGNDLLVGVPEMRLAVDVVNGRRDVIPFRHLPSAWPSEGALATGQTPCVEERHDF